MKTKSLLTLGFIILHSAFCFSAFAQGTAFTYQGRLTDNGAALTDLNAANVSSGTLDANRIPNLDASKITSGTLADARLSTNVALRGGGNAFTGNQSIAGNLAVNGNVASGAGAIASGFAATAMGYSTVASGNYSTAIGYDTTASGGSATAMGNLAEALHLGSFVWADALGTPFASTADNQFLIRAAGGVGIGTASPQTALHVYSANSLTSIRVQSGAVPGFGRIEFVSDLQSSGNEWRPGYIQSTDNGGFTGGLAFFVNGTGAVNRFGGNEVMRVVNGAVGIGTATPVSPLHVVGTVTATAFNPPSDRNLKENFAAVNPREVLDKVTALPISRWNFKGDSATPHVGPMAQDFHAAFRVGTDERHIAIVDADDVALAAIQGLNQKLERRKTGGAGGRDALEGNPHQPSGEETRGP